jgi:hypothetical protein
LTRLDELVDGELDQAAAAHQAQCQSCAELLRGVRRNAGLLRALGAPPIPAEVGAPDVLARIYERSAEISESRLGRELRAALTPVKAPRDAVWLDDEGTALDPWLRALFTRARSPGWMWRRIRAGLADQESEARAPARWRWASLAAAAVLMCGLVLVGDPLGSRGAAEGTYPLIPVVFETLREPIEPAFSLGSLAEAGR